jgi:choline monooxygenase
MPWGPLPFSPDDVRAEVARFDPALPVERAATPPASWYVDPRFAELDRRAVFGRSWQAVGLAAEVAAPGAFTSGCLAGIPWLVVRGDDGVLRGFHNSCRHKGREVVTGRGVAGDSLVCGYHAWAYGLDGRLKRAPRMAGVLDFDREAMSLVPLAVETWGPWLFVHAGEARPLALRLAELQRRLPARGWDRHRHLDRREVVVRANWKTVVDNYLDGGYHVPHMHPSLAAQLDMSGYRTELLEDCSIQHAPPAGDGPAARIGEGALYAWIYPAFMINVYGPWIDSNTVVPLGHGRCKIVFDFFLAEALPDDVVRKSIAQSEVTQREDTEICESVQIGLGSPSYDRGRYAPRVEAGEHHFHRLLAADYGVALRPLRE